MTWVWARQGAQRRSQRVAWVCREEGAGTPGVGLDLAEIQPSPAWTLVAPSFPWPSKITSAVKCPFWPWRGLCPSNTASLPYPPSPLHHSPFLRLMASPSFACLLGFVVFNLDVVRERRGQRTGSPIHSSTSPDRQTCPARAQRPDMVLLAQQMGKFWFSFSGVGPKYWYLLEAPRWLRAAGPVMERTGTTNCT